MNLCSGKSLGFFNKVRIHIKIILRKLNISQVKFFLTGRSNQSIICTMNAGIQPVLAYLSYFVYMEKLFGNTRDTLNMTEEQADLYQEDLSFLWKKIPNKQKRIFN